METILELSLEDKYIQGIHHLNAYVRLETNVLVYYFENNWNNILIDMKVYSDAIFFSEFLSRKFILPHEYIPFSLKLNTKKICIHNNNILKFSIDLTYPGKEHYIGFKCNTDKPTFYLSFDSSKIKLINKNKIIDEVNKLLN